MTTPDDETNYASQLAHERHMYAWCLVVYGGSTQEDARAIAEEFYPHEEPDAPHRGLVFHDQAWHWAMLRIFGADYWVIRPGTEKPSAQYETESRRYEALH